MRLIVQIVSVIGMLISMLYLYNHNWDFAALTALLSFIAIFGGSFYLSKAVQKSAKLTQKVGDNSTAYQSNGDMNIGDKK